MKKNRVEQGQVKPFGGVSERAPTQSERERMGDPFDAQNHGERKSECGANEEPQPIYSL